MILKFFIVGMDSGWYAQSSRYKIEDYSIPEDLVLNI